MLDLSADSIVVLAVKPPSLPSVFKELQRFYSRKSVGLVISICAGATIKNLEHNVSEVEKLEEYQLQFSLLSALLKY